MSMLPPEMHVALSQLLQALQSSDNNVRSQAEAQLNGQWTSTQPAELLVGLAEQMQGNEDAAARSFAAVLFRRISNRQQKDTASAESKELFLSLPPEPKVAIRTKLLQCLASEQGATVRNKIGDAVAEIARQYTDNDEQWPELLSALFQASQSTEPEQRENAFRIFATTPGIIEKQHEDAVLGAFNKGFKDDNVSVRLAAVEAFAAFFHSITKKQQSKYFPLLPEILNVLPPLKETSDGDNLSKAFIALIELAEVSPKMFKPLFNNLVKFSISVIQEKELGDATRQNALELMATFADYAPVMCKKDSDYTSSMVTQCLSLMTDIGIDDDDASEWNESEDLDTEESDQNHVAGEQCMDRLANKLGGQALLPATFSWLPRMMVSSSWRDRHAALMAISAISEGCRELMLGELNQVLELVVPSLRDAHPRVRYAGCNALGQMSTDFAGTMQEKYHQVVLESIIPVLKSPEPRVKSHAAAALVNFCEEAEKGVLEPYLDPLLENLLTFLGEQKRFVQEQALSTIATIADSAETSFGKYYDHLMPLLFQVLQQEQDKEYRLLRAKAMECATLIALAVGKDRMGTQAVDLVNALGRIQESVVDADDPQGTYLLHCWGRMCRVLGADFIPYLPAVMPPLLELAAAKADIQLLDNDEAVESLEQDEGWEMVPLKGKVIGIRTSTLEDKNTAIELITVYAQILDAAFELYVVDIMDKIAIPSLAFFFHDPVRVAAAKLTPQLLSCYKKAHGEQSPQFANLWSKTAEKIIEVLAAEPSIDTLAEMFQCFYESVEVAGRNSLTPTHMEFFIKSVESTLTDYQSRLKGRAEEIQENSAQNADGGDEEDNLSLEYAIEDDQNLLSDMNKAFHTVFKNHGPAFLPYWDRLRHFYVSFLESADATQRQWAICIYDDVLEFCGEQSFSYYDTFHPHLMKGLSDPAAANRQAAAYGVGIAAQKGGEAWSSFVAGCIPLLFQVCQVQGAREEEHVFATENACTSIAKVLRFSASKVENPQNVVVSWLETLPVTNDEEAAPYAYSFLSQLVDQSNPALSSRQSAEKAFSSIVQALEAETIQGTTAQKVVESAKALVQRTSLDADRVLASLSPEGQETVRTYFR
ncbi:MAG: hypothetical protein Q9227_007925 [Pyrenula ochraceoflavens]